MHEATICESILQTMRELKREKGYAEIRSVSLEIGELQLVMPDALDFAFSALTKGTEFENVKLIQNLIPGRGTCNICQVEQARATLYEVCQQCGGYDFTMRNGMELNIVKMEVEKNV